MSDPTYKKGVFTTEQILRFAGYIYCLPCFEWDYPHVLTPHGYVIPVSGLDDDFIKNVVKEFESANTNQP